MCSVIFLRLDYLCEPETVYRNEIIDFSLLVYLKSLKLIRCVYVLETKVTRIKLARNNSQLAPITNSPCVLYVGRN